MTYNNFKISRSKGEFYISSKTKLEGYDPVVYDNGNKTTYHKYFKKIQGKLTWFGTKEVNIDNRKVQFLEVTLSDGDTKNVVSVPLKTIKGNLSEEARALISSLYGAEKGAAYSMSVSVKENTSEGKTYKNLNVYVNSLTVMNDQGKGVSTGFIPFSEIPRIEKEEDGLGGFTSNHKNVNAFWGNKLKEISARFATNSEQSSPQENKQNEKTASEDTKVEEITSQPDENDDLPF